MNKYHIAFVKTSTNKEVISFDFERPTELSTIEAHEHAIKILKSVLTAEEFDNLYNDESLCLKTTLVKT